MATPARSSVVICFVLAAACGAERGSRPSRGPVADTSAAGPLASMHDAGAVRACTHDVRDLAPCVEDCDRAIAFSCAVLATRLERGEGVARDLPRAVRLHERACELRDAASCVSAARMFASGAGVPPSRARQVELLGIACGLGDALACAIPAKAFANGNGVPRDERRAKELLQRACTGGVQTACDEIDAPP